MRRNVRFYLLVSNVIALAAVTPNLVTAQDTHYWNGQYGPRSMLLGGAVIGSVNDMSGTYYNPGTLGYIEKPELLLSANVYQISNLTVRDGAGEGLDLEASDFNPLPNMLAGAFRKSWLGKNKLAYSFLTRYQFNAELRGGRVDRVDVLPRSPGEEDFAGGLLSALDLKELWVGLTWSRGSGETVGFGVTQYLSIRNLDRQYEVFAQALTDTGDFALVYDLENYSTEVYSFLWKIGLGFDFWPLTAGITVTTPNVQIYSSGRSSSNTTVAGLDVDGDGSQDNVFEANIQEDVAANYKSPLSVGVGAALNLGRINIHASAEWFDAVDKHFVLELEPFVSQGTGEAVTPTIAHQAESVLNYAAGLEMKGEKYAGYLSFNTDFSSIHPESDIAVTGFDVYHVTGGTNVTFKKTQFMLGLSYAWGSEKVQQIIDLDPGEDQGVINPDDQVDVVFERLTFILGFTVSL